MNKTQFSFFKKTHFIKPIYLILLTAMASSTLSSTVSAATLIDRVVAVVNKDIILKSELNTQMFAKEQELTAQNIPLPDPKVLQEKVLDSLILERLQVQRAEQIGLEVSDEDINQQLLVVAQQNRLTLMALRKRLDLEMPNGFELFRQQMRTKILVQKLREAEVISQAYVSQTEVDNYLQRAALDDRNIEVELGHILISIPESATPEQRELALQNVQQLQGRLKIGEDFSQLAIRHSSGSKALNGGNLGWFKQNDVPTFFAKAIKDLKTGEISEIIQSPSGFHLIKLINKKDTAAQVMKNLHLHRFLLPTDKAGQAEIPTQLMMLSQSLRSLEDFKALHDKLPDIPANINANTDLGWKKLSELPEALRKDLANLNANRALLPIATNTAWMILFLEEVQEVEQASSDKAQKAVQAIRMRKANEMFELWLRRLKDEAFIEIRLQEKLD